MPDARSDFHGLLQRIRAGDPDAARQLHDAYAPHLQRIIRRQLRVELRSLYADDILQSTWRVFFLRTIQEQAFQSPESLLAWLTRAACNKAIDYGRKHQRQSFGGPGLPSLSEPKSVRAGELLDPDPGPDQVAAANDLWHQLLAGRPAHEQRILEKLRAGHTHQSIADACGVNEKTVRRLLAGLAEHCLRQG